MTSTTTEGAGPTTAGPAAADDPANAFSTSMVVSGIRCMLTYVVFPFVFPLIGLADSIGPAIGLPIGIIAIIANVFSIRRFHASAHKWRWPVTVLSVAVIGLLSYLVVDDLQRLIG